MTTYVSCFKKISNTIIYIKLFNFNKINKFCNKVKVLKALFVLKKLCYTDSV